MRAIIERARLRQLMLVCHLSNTLHFSHLTFVHIVNFDIVKCTRFEDHHALIISSLAAQVGVQ